MTRARGMDHTHYAYSPLPTRPRLVWPENAHLALTLFLHFEYWELNPPPGSHSDPRFGDTFGNFFPDYRTYSWREYGNRVGIFRILEILDRYNLNVTVAAGAAACERYPFLVKEFLSRGYEFAAHGNYATRLLTSRNPEDHERDVIASSIATVEAACGRRPTGWISQDQSESARTPALLAEAGLSYVVDWPNDDQPYPMTVARPLLSIPYQAEWDDVQLLWHRRVLSPRYPVIIGEAFDRLHREGRQSGRFFGLHIHPWLFGMPHRTRYLDEALARITGRDGVWNATAGSVAAHVMSGGGNAKTEAGERTGDQ